MEQKLDAGNRTRQTLNNKDKDWSLNTRRVGEEGMQVQTGIQEGSDKTKEEQNTSIPN